MKSRVTIWSTISIPFLNLTCMVLLHLQGSIESKVSTGLPVLTLRFRDFFILVWSIKLRFKIWWISNQWLLRYLTLSIFQSRRQAGWVAGWIWLIIIPLRGPSCKLRLARFSVKLKLQDGPSVAKFFDWNYLARKKIFFYQFLSDPLITKNCQKNLFFW